VETRTSAMVVGLYLFGAMAVAGVVYYAYDRTIENSRAQLQMAEADEPGTARVGRVPFPSTTFAAASRPTRDLHTSLVVTRDQLERRTIDLNRKNEECQALKAELDESFALIMSLLAEDSKNDANKDSRSKLEAELARLQEAIAKSEALNFQQEQELAELQAEVMQNKLDLEATQDEAKRDVESLAAEHQTLDAVARAVIARAGSAAIPALLELLVDEHPEVRKWAAHSLGAIGPDATDAIANLQDLLSDPEASVRAEAQRAIDAIAGNELD
jgi:hypothetical protein